MTEQQTAINSRALIAAAAILNLAEKLERWGLSDPHQRAEHIAMNLLADGYREIESPPALHGPSSTKAGREAARQIFEQTRQELADRDRNRATADPNGVTR